MGTLGRAIAIAAAAHEGQTTRAAEPFILHPLRVMLRVEGEAERRVAVLHDVVENTDWTLEQLRGEGFSAPVVEAVDALTRQDGEAYLDFVRRAVATPLAVPVKRADLLDNLAMTRALPMTPKTERRVARYRAALEIVGVALQASLADVERDPLGVGAIGAASVQGVPSTATAEAGGLLAMPAAVAVRLLALERLLRAERAVAPLKQPPDPDAVHDLRVAIRRLRSLMRSYPELLRRRIGRKGRQGLRALTAAAGGVRDLDVRLVWFEALPPNLRGARGAASLHHHLEQARQQAASQLAEQLGRDLPRLGKRLRRRLGRIDAAEARTFMAGTTFQTALAEAATQLRQQFVAARAASVPGDEGRLHALRIAEKRLRYTLEPLGSAFDAPPALARLEQLQDLLGTARDLALLFAELDREAGAARALDDPGAAQDLAALQRRAASERDALLARFEADWIGAAGEAALQPVDRVLANLTQAVG